MLNNMSCRKCVLSKEALDVTSLNFQTSQKLIATLEEKDKLSQNQIRQYKTQLDNINKEFIEKYDYYSDLAVETKMELLRQEENNIRLENGMNSIK